MGFGDGTGMVWDDAARRFEQIARSIDHVLWMMAFDPPRPVYLSPAFERMCGVSMQEFFDDPSLYERLFHPDDRARVIHELTAWFEEPRRPFCTEYRIIRPDGSERAVRLRAHAMLGPDGRIHAASGVAEDITDERAAEAHMAFQASALEQISDAIMALDRDMRVTFWNTAAERLSGIPAADVLGLPLTDLSPRWVTDEATRRSLCDDLLVSGIWRGESAYTSRDGREMHLECTVSALREGQANGGFLCVIRDVTEARRTRDALEDSNRRLHQLLTDAPSVLYAMDPTEPGRVRFMGANVERILGYPASKFLADPGFFARQVHPDDARNDLVDLIAQGTFRVEYRFRHADGSWRWMRDEATLTRDEDGNPLEVTGFWTDITETKRLERELQQAQKLEALGAFAGGIAHDFNNLLMGISGCADVALRKLDGEHPSRRFVAELKRAARSGTQVVSQLLAFSRKREVQPQLLELTAVVSDSEKMLRHLVGEDIDLRIESEIEDGADLVRCDPGQVQQILMNLVANARHAMPRGGLLELRLFTSQLGPGHPALRAGEYVGLSVRDEGVGMDEATLAHVFEPFFTTREAEGGTGLGLATVYGIVKQAGGHIAVESSRGAGTTFTIHLPRASGTTVEMAAVPPPPEPPGDVTVLVVEDEPLVRLTIRHYLEGAGYRVLEAEDGVRALSVCREYPGAIGLLITDIVLPGAPGPQVAEAVSRMRPDMPTIFVSAYPREKLERDGRLSPGELSLEKPFSEEQLLAMAHQALHEPAAAHKHAIRQPS